MTQSFINYTADKYHLVAKTESSASNYHTIPFFNLDQHVCVSYIEQYRGTPKY